MLILSFLRDSFVTGPFSSSGGGGGGGGPPGAPPGAPPDDDFVPAVLVFLESPKGLRISEMSETVNMSFSISTSSHCKFELNKYFFKESAVTLVLNFSNDLTNSATFVSISSGFNSFIFFDSSKSIIYCFNIRLRFSSFLIYLIRLATCFKSVNFSNEASLKHETIKLSVVSDFFNIISNISGRKNSIFLSNILLWSFNGCEALKVLPYMVFIRKFSSVLNRVKNSCWQDSLIPFLKPSSILFSRSCCSSLIALINLFRGSGCVESNFFLLYAIIALVIIAFCLSSANSLVQF